MLVGLNTAVHYRNETFHVQTEDGGSARPAVTTHLFYRGAVIASARSEYAPAPSREDLRRLMERQHRAVIVRLEAGSLDAQIREISELPQPPAAARRGRPSRAASPRPPRPPRHPATPR